MKNLIVGAFLFLSSIVTAQENLQVENGKIKWQKVYETDLTEVEIKDILRRNAVLSPISDNLSGEAKPVDLDCEDRQAIYMRDNIVFFALIEVKDGRYRATVENVRFIPSSTVELWGTETTTDPEHWEEYQVKNNGELRSNKMAQNSRSCLDNYLSNLFTFEKVDDSW